MELKAFLACSVTIRTNRKPRAATWLNWQLKIWLFCFECDIASSSFYLFGFLPDVLVKQIQLILEALHIKRTHMRIISLPSSIRLTESHWKKSFLLFFWKKQVYSWMYIWNKCDCSLLINSRFRVVLTNLPDEEWNHLPMWAYSNTYLRSLTITFYYSNQISSQFQQTSSGRHCVPV